MDGKHFVSIIFLVNSKYISFSFSLSLARLPSLFFFYVSFDLLVVVRIQFTLNFIGWNGIETILMSWGFRDMAICCVCFFFLTHRDLFLYLFMLFFLFRVEVYVLLSVCECPRLVISFFEWIHNNFVGVWRTNRYFSARV